MLDDRDLLERARKYAESKRITLKTEARLGYGSDGTVWETSASSALKILGFQKNYRDELGSYRRLAAKSVREICGLAVPMLIDSNDDLLAIEMSIVQPPYLLDFGKVYLDNPPPYLSDAQLMQNALAERRELFGKRWPKVSAALSILRQRFGIYYVDPRPGNINFGDHEDED